MRTTRLHLVLPVLAAAASAAVWHTAVAGSSTNSALPLCYSVTQTSSVIGNHSVGPVCVPYPYATHCEYLESGLYPPLYVKASACVPLP